MKRREILPIHFADIRRVPGAEGWFRNVYPLYLHELSLHGGKAHALDEGGKWRPDTLSDWLFEDADHEAICIMAGERRIGFLLAGHKTFPHKSPGVDHIICEFFILPLWRRAGSGRRAMRRYFADSSGDWEAFVLTQNAAAHAFWDSVLDGFAEYKAEKEGSVIRYAFSLD